MNKTPLHLYLAVSGLHDSAAVQNAHRELFEALNSQYDVAIHNIRELTEAGSKATLFVATGGVEESIKAAIDKSNVKDITLIADGLQNSLAASMEVASWLATRDIEGRIIHGDIPYILDRVSHMLIKNALNGCRVGQLGEPSGWLISSNVDYAKVSQEYGIEFVKISLDEIEEEFKTAAPAEVSGIHDLKKVEPTGKDLDLALRLTTAIENVVKRHNLDAFSLKCFDLLKPLDTTGCLALAVLNAKGIPAGCEGDMPALLTMLLAQRLTGAPGFMANPSRIDSQNNEITIAHCTLPLNMAGENILRSHFESGIGVALQGILPLGSVTVVKWWGAEMNEYFLTAGQLLENLDNPSMCRTQIRLKLDAPVDYFLTRPLGNHHVILLGDHTHILKEFFNLNNVSDRAAK